jgi:ATP-dependent protease ClpP protease subunit
MTEVATKEALKLERQSIDIEVRRAELELKRAELRKTTADALEAELQAEARGISLVTIRKEEERKKLLESQKLVYGFNAEINDGTVDNFVDWLEDRRLRFPGQELTVYLNSPGGSVFSGFVAQDAIREAVEGGNPVTVKVTGMAASMAGVIAQTATKRLIGKNSELMLHTTASFAIGKSFEISDVDEFVRRLTRKCMASYAERSDKWDTDALFEKVHGGRKDWWLSADEAVEEGFMDGTF